MSYTFNAAEITFRPQVQRFVKESIINPRINSFFRVRDICQFEELIGRKCITDLNFKAINIKYFYNIIFAKIEGNSVDKTLYSITFDKQMATLQCEQTQLLYNELCLGEKPVLYFIYFDPQEIFDAVRVHSKVLKTKRRF
jgi:hypothetical protein